MDMPTSTFLLTFLLIFGLEVSQLLNDLTRARDRFDQNMLHLVLCKLWLGPSLESELS
jgi:hypothetical protein